MGASGGSIKSDNAAQRGEFPARFGAYLLILAAVLRAFLNLPQFDGHMVYPARAIGWSRDASYYGFP
jgi:hypothetical protein